MMDAALRQDEPSTFPDLLPARVLVDLGGFAVAFDAGGKPVAVTGNCPFDFDYTVGDLVERHCPAAEPGHSCLAVEWLHGFRGLLYREALPGQRGPLLVAVPEAREQEIVFNTLPVGILHLDLYGRALAANEAVADIFGCSRDELLGTGWQPALTVTAAEDFLRRAAATGTSPVHETFTPLGSLRRLDVRVVTLAGREAGAERYLLVVNDITETYQARARLSHAETHDQLTGLPTRETFTRRINSLRGTMDLGDSLLALISIDGFRAINDQFGHRTGDAVLCFLAGALRSEMRQEDLVARVGGHEFAFFVPRLPPTQGAQAVAERLELAVKRTVDIDGLPLEVSASLGLVAAGRFLPDGPEEHDIVDGWLRMAGTALTSAKQHSDQSVAHFEERHRRAQRERGKRFREYHEILARQKLPVAFQPILRDGAVVAVEALSRPGELAVHDNLEALIATAKLQPGAVRFFNLMTRSALEAYAALSAALSPASAPRLNVNLDVLQLTSKEAIEDFLRQAGHRGLAPSQLTVEVTEKTLESSPPWLRANLTLLKEAGCALSLDDFGTGYSSMRRLIDYEFDQVKLDRSFAQEIADSPSFRAVTGAVAMLGKELEMDIVAEGIETAAQQANLLSRGIRTHQGYYLCRPAAEEDIVDRLRELTGPADHG